MRADSLLTLYGLKFNPFRPDVPHEALLVTPPMDAFCRKVEFALSDGGFALVTGDPGTGKSIVLRVLAHRLRKLRDVSVASLDHPTSSVADLYRELADLFEINLRLTNRWGGFKALRARWSDHIATTLTRPVLIIDEAQEMLDSVFSELRLLSSKEFDSRSLLCVVFAGDRRLLERFRQDDLLPLATRIRRRLDVDFATRDELCACLDHVLDAAGNSALMTTELKATLAEHAAGNYRIMMNSADELLAVAADRKLDRLDEKLFFDLFAPPTKPKPNQKRR